jgi:hypothetical protein
MTPSAVAYLRRAGHAMAGRYPGPSCLEPHDVDYVLAGREQASNTKRWLDLVAHVEKCEDCRKLLNRAGMTPSPSTPAHTCRDAERASTARTSGRVG